MPPRPDHPDVPSPRFATGIRLLERTAAAMLAAIQTTSAEPPLVWSELLFDTHAVDLFMAQYEAIPVYRAWADRELGARGQVFEDVRHWRDVPALPIAAFKRMRVAPEPGAGGDAADWWSSGTTGVGTSHHHLQDTALYDASLRYGVRHALLPDAGERRVRAIQLAPTAADAPNSSLSHMLDAARLELCDDGGAWVSANFVLDGPGAWQALEQAAADEQPVLLLATSFALVQLFDAADTKLTLPAGSRVMDTGGYKGRTRELTREQLLALIGERLGVPPMLCENEYGMSELSSQAWLGTIAAELGAPLPAPHGGRWQPPWMRTRVVSPETLEEVEDGEEGLLVHHDLANAWSCAAIRTEDWGMRRGRSYALLGRAPGAELRGCSLQLEDVL